MYPRCQENLAFFAALSAPGRAPYQCSPCARACHTQDCWRQVENSAPLAGLAGKAPQPSASCPESLLAILQGNNQPHSWDFARWTYKQSTALCPSTLERAPHYSTAQTPPGCSYSSLSPFAMMPLRQPSLCFQLVTLPEQHRRHHWMAPWLSAAAPAPLLWRSVSGGRTLQRGHSARRIDLGRDRALVRSISARLGTCPA